MSRDKNNLDIPEVKGCYSIMNAQNNTLTEVLHPWTVPMSGLCGIIESEEKDKKIKVEYTCFVEENNKEENVYCISPNDDYRI